MPFWFRAISIALFLIIKTIHAIPFYHGENIACDPNSRAWTKYTGIRIQRQFRYTLGTETTDHKMIISHCNQGILTGEEEYNVAPDVDIAWNTSLSNGDEDAGVSTRLARRAPYTKRDISIYFPGTLVGALFKIRTVNTEIEPEAFKVEPLLADRPLGQWTQLDPFSQAVVHRIPLLYTADVLDRRYTLATQGQHTWINKNTKHHHHDDGINMFENYPGYFPKVATSSVRKTLFGSNVDDMGAVSRHLVYYTPIRFITALRYVQSYLDEIQI